MEKIHFDVNEYYTACGVVGNSHDTTKSVNMVTCGNCMNTKKYKEAVKETKKKVAKSYNDRQSEWSIANDIQEGDKVRVTRIAKDYEDGWNDCWVEEMTDSVGQEGEVIEFDYYGVSCRFSNSDEYAFPYFVLEKVVEATDIASEHAVKLSEDVIAPYVTIEYTIINDLWSIMCGAENNFEDKYQCISFNPEKGFAIFSEMDDKSPRLFKVLVQEMELVEKDNND